MATKKDLLMDAKIQEESDEQVDLASTIYSLVDQGLLKTLIKEHDYDVSLRRLPLEKLPKGVNDQAVIDHFNNKNLHTVDSFYFNMIYDFTELGIIDNEEINIDKAVKPIINLIDEINEEINLDKINHNNEVNEWKKFGRDVLAEYEEAQCLKKLRIKKLYGILKEVDSEIAYINKKLQKFTPKKGKNLAKQVHSFFSTNFGINLYDGGNPLNKDITDVLINFSYKIEKETFEFLVYYLELFSKYYKHILEIAKDSKIKDAYQIFDLDYSQIKRTFYDSLIPTREQIIPNADGFILNEAYIKYFSYDFGTLLGCLEKSTGKVVRNYITAEILRRKKIDRFVQVAPNVFSYGLFAFMLYVLYVYEFTLLKEMSGRLIMLVTYCLLFVSFVFCNVNLIRNTIQFKRPKRARYQKRSFVVLLIFALISGGIEAFLVNRYDGYDDNFYYCITEDNEIILEDVRNKEIINVVVPDTVDSLVCPELTTEEKVTKINKRAFYNVDSIETVILSDNIVEIGNKTFENCSNLEECTLPSGLEVIPKEMFKGCSQLKKVTGPAKITKVEESAFEFCNELIKFEYFDTLEYVEKDAFNSCWTLTSIVFGENIKEIHNNAFYDCYCVVEVVIPTAPERLGKNVFKQCSSIEEVTLSLEKYHFNEYFNSSVKENIQVVNLVDGTKIPDEYFKNATELREVNISSEITEIGASAFEECLSLFTFDIPETVTKIGDAAFKHSAISEVTIPTGITIIPQNSFESCDNLLTVILPETTLEIGNAAFNNCYTLKNITLPNKLKKIGEYSFYGCTRLSTVTLPSSLTHVGNEAFGSCDGVTISGLNKLESIGDYAFVTCNVIGELSLESIKHLGKGAFGNMTGLESLIIDCKDLDNVSPLYNDFNLGGVKQVTIKNLKDIPEFFFNDASSLRSVSFVDCELNEIKDGVFKNCVSLKSIDLSQSNYKYIGKEAFKGCTELESVILGSNITEIRDEAFMNCVNLTQIDFPTSLKVIGKSAFEGCDSLTSLTINSSLEEVKEAAFFDCDELKTLVINFENFNKVPKLLSVFGNSHIQEINVYNLSSMPEDFLSGFNTLLDVRFYDCDFDAISKNAFKDCGNLRTINLGSLNITSISESAFENCGLLSVSSIPNTVKSIGKRAFYNCDEIYSITIPGSVQTIGDSAFADCHRLQSAYIDYSSATEINEIKDIFKDTAIRFLSCTKLNSIPDFYCDRIDTLTEIIFNDCSFKEIGRNAFFMCHGLTEFDISNVNVEKISERAFEDCYNINNFKFSSSLKVIDDYAFSACQSLSNLQLPNGLTTIGKETFTYLQQLSNLEIPSTVTKIGKFAFDSCPKIKTVMMPIVGKSFYNIFNSSTDNITQVTLTNGNSIPKEYFSGLMPLQKVVLADTVSVIEKEAFRNCTSLDTINLNDVVEINDSAFDGCSSLTSLSISDKLVHLGKKAFRNCHNLQTVPFQENLKEIGANCFDGCHSLSQIRIPSSVTKIGSGAFTNCGALTSVSFKILEKKFIFTFDQSFEDIFGLAEIGHNITNVEIRDTEKIPNNYFSSIASIRKISFDENVKELGKNVFKNCSDLEIVDLSKSQITELPKNTFKNSTSLRSVMFNQDITVIGEGAFKGCTSLNQINLQESEIEVIEKEAFANCDSLSSVLLSGSLKELGKKAFYDCDSLVGVDFGESKIEVIPEDCFAECSSLNTVQFSNNLKVIDKNAFSGCGFMKIDLSQTQLEEINSRAFEYCHNLDTVVLPNTLEALGSYAFSECMSLSNINLSDTKITIIPKYCFYNCGEYSPVIPEGIKEIEKYAYKGCGKITNLVIPSSVEKIGHSSLAVDSIETLHIDLSNEKLYKKSILEFFSSSIEIGLVYVENGDTIKSFVFYALPCEYVFIGEGIKTIETFAFASCNLKGVMLPNSLEEVKGYAFSGCYNLERVDITNINEFLEIEFKTSTSNPLKYGHTLYLNGFTVNDLVIDSPRDIKKHQFVGLYADCLYIVNCGNIENGSFKNAKIEKVEVELKEADFLSKCEDKTILESKIKYIILNKD